jgi:adenine-specific DNA-methyltransferase
MTNENSMKKLTAADPETKSADVVTDNVARLRELFPEAFAEGKIDFEVLKQVLGGAVDEREEKFGLNWHGKRQARQLALTPSTGTLLPCPQESVDWDTTQNLMIEGDNLEVLKLLQKSYARKVKLIYIDPPYNTGKDFVYPDRFQDSIANYLELTGQSGSGMKLKSNPEASGRFHTDWLNMMYSRLRLSRDLLTDDGAIFVSIDDHEVDDLRRICAELFGEENFVATICWERADSPRMDADYFSVKHDYIVCFARNLGSFSVVRRPYQGDDVPIHFGKTDNDGRRYYLKPLRAMGGQGETRAARPNLYFGIEAPNGAMVFPKLEGGGDGAWRWSKNKVALEKARLDWAHDAIAGTYAPYYRIYADESAGKPPETMWFSEDVGSTRTATAEVKELFDDVKVFDTPKPIALLARIISLTTQSDDVILDFFAGSGTTAHAVMAQNARDGADRRFILVQLPEPLDAEDKEQHTAAEYCNKIGVSSTIAELTKERIRRASKAVKAENPMFAGTHGFRVFKLASSNIRAWAPVGADIPKTLQESVDHLKTNRTESDILYELLLKRGLNLCVPIQTRQIAGRDVHSIGGGVLFACLAQQVPKDKVEALALGIVDWHKALKPIGEVTCVFRDSAFVDDVAKTNLAAILKQNGLANVRCL